MVGTYTLVWKADTDVPLYEGMIMTNDTLVWKDGTDAHLCKGMTLIPYTCMEGWH